MKVPVLLMLTVLVCLVESTTNNSSVEEATDQPATVVGGANKTSSIFWGETEVDHSVQRWISAEKNMKKMVSTLVKSLLPHIMRIREDLNLSAECSRDLLKLLVGFKQLKYWAFKMFDSSGKLPNGIMSGSINAFGDYDECLNTVVPGSFRGQFCLVEVSPPVPPRRSFVSYDNEIPEFINVTDPDSITKQFMKRAMYYHHLNFRSSACVPSTCLQDDVQKIAQKVIDLAGIGFDVVIPNCETKVDKMTFNTSEIIIIIALSTILALALSATIADIFLKVMASKEDYHEDLKVLMKCWMCFSLYTNGRRLLRKDDSPDTIKIFHGMKVITILWIILNHTYYYLNYQALSSLLRAREAGRDFAFQFIVNGFLSVETFFFISAVLVSYGVTKMKHIKLNIFLFAFRRFWRLTPPFMFVIACICLLPHFGSGPIWKETVVDGLTGKCKSYWWTNLLFFNNFLPNTEMCMNWSWYIPVDTHLYFLSLIVLIPLRRNVKLAFVINGALLVFGIFVTAVSHIYYKLHPTAIYVYIHPEDINYFVDRGYFRTYLHISSYSIGLTVGYILATKKKIKIPMAANIVGWLVAFALCITLVYGVYDWNQGNVPGVYVSTLYACTSKLMWSLALAWVTISCMSGNGGIATTILSWNAFVPLGRLTYMTYLIHPVIQFIYIGSTRTIIRSEHRTMVYMYLGNVVLGFLLACGFSLLFESPFMALEKVIFSTLYPKHSFAEKNINCENETKNEDRKLEVHTKISLDEDFLNSRNIFTINFKQQKYDF